ncbi:MAG: 50S ribosomal protein L30e [Candidatus Diapherotrites archaeon]|nr:50S ribosomal protein L30e [Candidatus Diapherotrites archaeon]
MEAVDVIKRIMETGRVTMGTRSVLKQIAAAKPKLIVVSSNCPKKTCDGIREKAQKTKVRVYTYPGTAYELGEACRKPFPISAMAVLDPGQADLTALKKE